MKQANRFKNISPYYILSALCFHLLWWWPIPCEIAGTAIAMLLSLYFYQDVKTESTPAIRKLAAVSAACILLNNNINNCLYFWFVFNNKAGVNIISILLSAGGFYFLYLWLVFFYVHLADIYRDIFKDISKREICIYALMLLATSVFAAAVFYRTTAFNSAKYIYDVIYTSDSGSIMNPDAFTHLRHPDNDIRQPLFSLYTAPLTGIFQAISLFFPKQIGVAVLNCSQIAIMLFTNYVLSKLLKLREGHRICFMCTCCCTYSYLLFSIMIEQYIIATFWLITFIYASSNEKKSMFALCGAGGTLLTSMAMAPLISEQKDIKQVLHDTIKAGFIYLLAILGCGKLDVIIYANQKMTWFSKFIESDPSNSKILQYLAFIKNYFALSHSTTKWKYDHIALYLPEPSFQIIGCFIFILAIISIYLNRKDMLTRICFYWIAFSVFILIVMGWGAPENGMILYSLYFGWPFLVLIFKLLQYADRKGRLIPAASAVLCAAMLYINIPSIIEVVGFSIKNYPA